MLTATALTLTNNWP